MPPLLASLIPILHTPRPGVTRLSLPYFMSDEIIDYITTAVAMTAKHGWKLLPQVCICIPALSLSLTLSLTQSLCLFYTYSLCLSLLQYRLNPETGVFCHHGDHPSQHRKWLSSISYESGVMTFTPSHSLTAPTLQVHTLTHSVSRPCVCVCVCVCVYVCLCRRL